MKKTKSFIARLALRSAWSGRFSFLFVWNEWIWKKMVKAWKMLDLKLS